MTTTPLAALPETRESPGQAGEAGRKHTRSVGTKRRPLKVMVKFRASQMTLKALEILQIEMSCNRTKAIELSIARAAAHVVAGVGTNNGGGAE